MGGQPVLRCHLLGGPPLLLERLAAALPRAFQRGQRALHRGEHSHQRCRAVSYANFGTLRFKTEHEPHLWGDGRVC